MIQHPDVSLFPTCIYVTRTRKNVGDRFCHEPSLTGGGKYGILKRLPACLACTLRVSQGVRPEPIDGIGDRLSQKLSAKWGVVPMESCGCQPLISKMNNGDIQWCQENEQEIIDHLLKGVERISISDPKFKRLKLVPRVIQSRYLGWLLNQSIQDYKTECSKLQS